jgi:hypothetical protein
MVGEDMKNLLAGKNRFLGTRHIVQARLAAAPENPAACTAQSHET